MGDSLKGLHYLDDFLILGAPDTTEGQRSLRGALDICARLGACLDHSIPWVRVGYESAQCASQVRSWHGRRGRLTSGEGGVQVPSVSYCPLLANCSMHAVL